MDFRNSTKKYPIGIKCNNPLNVSTAGWQGEVGIYNNPEREAIFVDTQHGLRAAALNLYSYYKTHGLHTIRAIISRWAPSNDPNANNDPNSYANFVARKTGINADTVFELNGTNIKSIMKAMAIIEQGANYAALIPDSDYDEGIKMADKKELLVTTAKIGLGGVAFFFSNMANNIKNKIKAIK
jgi:hypothetical protein